MRLCAAFAVLLFCTASFAGFTYIGAFNGSNILDNSDYYLFQRPLGLLYQDGRLFVTDEGKSGLYVLNASAMEGNNSNQRVNAVFSTGSEARFSNPYRLEFLNGTIYVADGASSKIKTYSGAGLDALDWNSGSNIGKASSLAFDGQFAYITDQAKGMVYAYSLATKSYDHVSVERGGSDGKLESPADIESYKGRFYISDSSKGLIFVYDSNFSFLNSIGRGRAGVTLLSPRGIELYQDRLYVADAPANSVMVFTLDGYPVENLSFPSTEANLSYPEDLAIANGRIYVSDSFNKLVKAYSIEQLTGNDTVLQQINAAKQAISRLFALQDVATRLKVPFSPSKAPEDLASAQADYSNFLFSSSSVLAQNAASGADSSYDELSLAIELPIKKLVKEANDRVSPYRPRANGEIAIQLAQFDNKAAQVNTLIASKSFAQASDSALSLMGKAQGIIEAINDKEQQETDARENKTAKNFELEVEAAEGKLSRLKLDALTYRQDANFSASESFISQSRKFASEGDFESANHSLSLALLEISAYSSGMEAAKPEIDAALANFTSIELSFNATASQKPLFPTDLSSERLMLYQGRDTIYSNPQLGLSLSAKALEAASIKMRDSLALSTAAAAVISILFAIGLIGAAFGIHLLRRRGRKNHPSHEEEGQHSSEDGKGRGWEEGSWEKGRSQRQKGKSGQ